MSAGSEAVLYDIFGDPMAVEVNTAIPTGTALLIGGGSDGTNARYIKVDSSGNQVMIGLGTPGSQSGGIVTIQGDPSGTPIPITGAISATNPSVGTNDTTMPGSSTQIGGTDGTNLRSVRIFDLDSGGGTQWVLGVGLRKSAGGGSVELGTSSDPIRIDPTGTTTQPVSGTVTANQGGSWTVAGTGNFTVVQPTASNLRAQLASETNTGAAVPSTAIQAGGSDGTNLRPLFTDSSGRLIVIGAAANGAAVTGNPVLVSGSDGTNTRSIRTATDGTVRIDPTGTTAQPVTDNGGSLTIDTPQLPASLVGGRLDDNIGSWFGSTAPTVGQKVMASSIPVTIASNQSAIPVSITPAGSTSGIVAGIIQLGGSSAGSLNPVRATVYTEQAVDGQRSLKSSSASDSSAGTGVRTVEITYLDQNGNGPYTEIVTLNGTTAVTTTNTNICFIEKMTAKSVGSGLKNAGTISLYANTLGTGTVIGSIGIGNLIASQGDNQTLWAHHYVPTGKTASLATYIVSAESGGSGTNATYFLRKEPIPVVSTDAEVIISDLLIVLGPLVRQLGIPIKVTGPARVLAYGIPGGNNVRLNASFDFSEV